MSRSGYLDYWTEETVLYRGRVTRALRGKRGQAFLRELADAMDAMPEKVLISGSLIDETGDPCAIGVVCRQRGIDTQQVDAEDPESVGALVGVAKSMAAELAYINDEAGVYSETAEERWHRVREWVRRTLDRPA